MTIDCINSITQAINTHTISSDAGWIRADSEDGGTLRRIRGNPFLNRIVTRMQKFSTLANRLEREEVAKRALAELFWQTMYGKIEHNQYSELFFESGSTLSFMAEAFEKKVRHCTAEARWNVTTNNAVVMLQLLLLSNIRANPLPPAPPDDNYGAMFGHSLLAHPHAHPRIPRPLLAEEAAAVNEMAKQLVADLTNGKKRLFLATASGLDLSHKEEHFRGPHIGSHPNMLFKRAIFQTGHPIVLFLTEEKIGDPFDATNCFPVFSKDKPWTAILNEYPLAICIGRCIQSTDDDRAEDPLLQKLENAPGKPFHSFNMNYAFERNCEGYMLMIANAHFEKLFEYQNFVTTL